IDSILRDGRTHVEQLQVVAIPHGDTGASFDSGRVYVDDVFVGVATLWANFRRHARRRPRAVRRAPPVNELAQAISVNRFPSMPPTDSKAARFSQHCVPDS